MIINYNKAIFKTTHSSYSGGTRKSINFQLNSKIRGLEFDIHKGDLHSLKDLKGNFDFKLGHNFPAEDLSHKEDNPKSIYLADWLEILVNWSDNTPKHEPITLCLDIKENLVDSGDRAFLKFLNSLLRRKLNGRLYTHSAHVKWNSDSLTGTEWPSVEELAGKIIVFITGNHKTKWTYSNELPIREQHCFVAYSYEDDGAKDYSNHFLSEAKFVNCHLKYWVWGKEQLQKGKILRVWGFDPYYDNSGKLCLPTELNHQGLICNFPATDNPFDEWYGKAFNYSC